MASVVEEDGWLVGWLVFVVAEAGCHATGSGVGWLAWRQVKVESDLLR